MKSTMTVDQLRELLDREARGDFGPEGIGPDLQWFADHWPAVRDLRLSQLKLAQPVSFSTTYDPSLGLRKLIEVAVGEKNIININPDIIPERFPLKGTDVRTVNLRVEPYLNNETSEQAAQRLVAAGHTLASTGDLAGFLHNHPKEVEKWSWVLAISEDSRWANPDGFVCVPYASVNGAYRDFDLRGFRYQLDSYYGVLVSSESGI